MLADFLLLLLWLLFRACLIFFFVVGVSIFIAMINFPSPAGSEMKKKSYVSHPACGCLVHVRWRQKMKSLVLPKTRHVDGNNFESANQRNDDNEWSREIKKVKKSFPQQLTIVSLINTQIHVDSIGGAGL